MPETVKELAGKGAPWQKGVVWRVVLIEGLVALALGLFIFFQPHRAAAIILQLLGGYLLIASVLTGYRGVRGAEAGDDKLGLIAAGIGLVAGLLALLFSWIDAIISAAATLILAIGFLLVGGIGLFSVLRVACQGLR